MIGSILRTNRERSSNLEDFVGLQPCFKQIPSLLKPHYFGNQKVREIKLATVPIRFTVYLSHHARSKRFRFF